MVKRYLYIAALLFCLLSGSLQAQEYQQPVFSKDKNSVLPHGINEGNFLVNPQYEHLTRQLLRGAENFNYERYRVLYSISKYYDPIGEEAREQLLGIAYRVKNEQDDKKSQTMLAEYEERLKDHLANISVVMLAINLAKEDPRFGDPKVFENISDGLFASIKQFGNGASLMDAYQVVTMAEETMLLNSLPVKLLRTTSSHEGTIYYNMHEVEDVDTGRKHTIFVDITRPMEFLVRKSLYDPPEFSIR